jgi:hypothetical protein
VFDAAATAIRRLPPAARFAISAVGIACGFAAEAMMPSHKATIAQALLTLLCAVVAFAALAVFLVERRSRAKTPTTSPGAPPAPPAWRPQQIFGRIASLLGLAGLGGLATFGEWEGWIAVAGAVGYAVWRTWQMVKSGKTQAGAVPHLFVMLVGGSFIFEGVGFIAAAVFRGASG